MILLTPEKAYVFRITHVDNVRWILAKGLRCQNSEIQDPKFVPIGNPDIIGRRVSREVPIPPGGVLADYIPFYFTPFTPMLLNIKTGRGVPQLPMADIAILVTSLHRLAKLGISFVFTDRNACLLPATFSSDLSELGQLRWSSWQSRDFRRDPDDPDKVACYQAEALIHRHLSASALVGIVCYNNDRRLRLTAEATRRGFSLKVLAQPDWYI